MTGSELGRVPRLILIFKKNDWKNTQNSNEIHAVDRNQLEKMKSSFISRPPQKKRPRINELISFRDEVIIWLEAL